MVTIQAGQAAGALSSAIVKLNLAIGGLESVIADPDWAIQSVVLVNPHAEPIVTKEGDVDRETLVLMAETLKTSFEAKRDALVAQLEAI